MWVRLCRFWKCVKKAKVHCSKDCIDQFLKQITLEKDILGRKLLNIEPIKITSTQEK